MSLAEAQREPPRTPELGLALSGGGFRASFFHVGVLARLAETGVLRRVDTISTVSGGSILGALYYLAVKDLLESVPDDEVTDEHYVRVVQRVEKALFAGVSRQIRALAYGDLGKNFRMRRADYSRSDRIGELYDEIFYRPVWEQPLFGSGPAAGATDGPIQLRELPIVPPGEVADFSPRRHNHRRAAPVPVLHLNATSLNTGHNWRFQAVEMGEPARSRDSWTQVDKNMRLLSARYEEMTERQADFPLGHAVAASACVPALFHPLAVSFLFPGIRIELVDGGVHDNQGVGCLLDLDCARLIVSDASGQMSDIADPSTRIPAAAGRSSSIYGDRVREEQLIESVARPNTVLVHLRKGLPARGLSPLGRDGEPLAPTTELGEVDYGVAPPVQDRLSRVRTDLDSFSEVEAYSLSLYGHQMTSRELPEEAQRSYAWAVDDGDVEFLREQLREPGAAYLEHLTIAAQRFGKAAAFDRGMRALQLAALLVVGAVVVFLLYLLAGLVHEEVPVWALLIAIVLPALLVGLYFKQRFRLRPLYVLADGLFTWFLPTVAAPFLWSSSKLTLWASPKFLAAGRIARLRGR